MRATYFKRPLEFRLETPKDDYVQGETVQGTLFVRNAGSQAVSIQGLQVQLLYGLYKQIKAGEADGMICLEEKLLAPASEIAANASMQCEWEMGIPSDAPFSDKFGTLFLQYGEPSAPGEGNRIDLTISLMPVLQSFLQTFETQFNFKNNYIKYKNGFAEIKMSAPDSKQFSTLEYVICNARMVEKRMELQYKIRTKGFGRASENLKVVNKTKLVEQSFAPEEYLMGGNFPNRECFRNAVASALGQATGGVLS